MVPLRVSITKFEWLPDDPTAFVPSMLWKLLFITTWDDSQNRSHPTDSAEEADFFALHWPNLGLMFGFSSETRPASFPPICLEARTRDRDCFPFKILQGRGRRLSVFHPASRGENGPPRRW